MAKRKQVRKDIVLVAFDADDTLWENQPKYKHAERLFLEILSKYVSEEVILEELLKTEIQNLPICGYGTMSFCMSMIETAMRVSNLKITTEELHKLYELGKSLLKHPIHLYEGVEETIELINKKYSIVLITKGDTLEQERKIFSSGLMDKFDFIEIVHENDENKYLKVMEKDKIKPSECMLVGNSPKSDILPVLKIGGHAIYIPADEIWTHEMIDEAKISCFDNYLKLKKFTDITELLF